MIRGAVRSIRLPLLSALGFLLACAPALTSDFTSHYEAGEFEAAIEEYEQDPSLQYDPEVVLAVAVIYGSPSSRFYDPQRSTVLLRQWLRQFPDNSERHQVELILALLEGEQKLHSEANRAVAQRDSLQREVARVDTLTAASIEFHDRSLQLADSLANREAEIVRLQQQLAEVRKELERLKQVDLGES